MLYDLEDLKRMNYFNPKNKEGFFRDWYESDDTKSAYIELGFMTLAVIMIFAYMFITI